jgi:iron(III) transport system ATP-binding protein
MVPTMIEIRNLTKSFAIRGDSLPAVKDVDLSVAAGSFVTLLGPSGCGKTTLLRCLAGLESPDGGEIRIGGAVVYASDRGINVPVNRRQIGMVFQSYAIWPHMTVFENVAFPLRVQKMPNVRARVLAALETVELGALAQRSAARLSGGQQQRVAFARAIVAEPTVLLLDEPLSNLDTALRDQMRREMRRLHRTLGLTTILVTHDQEEALSLSDRIAVMRQGELVEEASPELLYGEPRSVFTAQFIGAANVFPGVAGEPQSGLMPIACAFGTLWSERRCPPGVAQVFVRPEKIRLLLSTEVAAGAVNAFPCAVKDRRFLGSCVEVELQPIAADPAFVLRSRDPNAGPGLGTAVAVTIEVFPHDVHVVAAPERS